MSLVRLLIYIPVAIILIVSLISSLDMISAANTIENYIGFGLLIISMFLLFNFMKYGIDKQTKSKNIFISIESLFIRIFSKIKKSDLSDE